jgi:[CysO sulfur-carrier protein]-S-L-cysteine hydrolase
MLFELRHQDVCARVALRACSFERTRELSRRRRPRPHLSFAAGHDSAESNRQATVACPIWPRNFAFLGAGSRRRQWPASGRPTTEVGPDPRASGARQPTRAAYTCAMDWDNSPWINGGLRITRAALDQVEKEAVAGYLAETEACGYLAGPDHDPLLCDRAVAIENMAKLLHERDPQTYFRSPRSFFAFKERVLEQAIYAGRAAGSPVKVLYHSHIDVGAYLSGTDQAVLSCGVPPQFDGGPATLGPGPSWPIAFLVTSVRGGVSEPCCDDHKLFIWRQRAFEQTSLDVV